MQDGWDHEVPACWTQVRLETPSGTLEWHSIGHFFDKEHATKLLCRIWPIVTADYGKTSGGVIFRSSQIEREIPVRAKS